MVSTIGIIEVLSSGIIGRTLSSLQEVDLGVKLKTSDSPYLFYIH